MFTKEEAELLIDIIVLVKASLSNGTGNKKITLKLQKIEQKLRKTPEKTSKKSLTPPLKTLKLRI